MRLNKIRLMIFVGLFVLGMLSSVAFAQTSVFKTLDKVTGRVGTLHIPVGSSGILGSLSITVRSCVMTPPEEPPETSVYVEIDDKFDHSINQIFAGWMFASSPSLNGLEHPVFDLWPTACKIDVGEALTGSE